MKKLILILTIMALTGSCAFKKKEKAQEPAVKAPAEEIGHFALTGSVVFDNDETAYNRPYSAIKQSDGKIVIFGQSRNDLILMRYLADGSGFDQDFQGGVVYIPSSLSMNSSTSGYEAQLITMQEVNGVEKILLLGRNKNSSKLSLARFNLDGTLDTSFSTAISTSLPVAAAAYITTQVIAGVNYIVVTGMDSSTYKFLVARYSENGVLLSQTSVGSNISRVTSVTIQSDGKIVVA